VKGKRKAEMIQLGQGWVRICDTESFPIPVEKANNNRAQPIMTIDDPSSFHFNVENSEYRGSGRGSNKGAAERNTWFW
jgi:hypothetical protein